MKAIRTVYHGPSNVRGSRITAHAEGVPSLTIPYPQDKDTGEPSHRVAAEALATRQEWLDGYRLVGGMLPDGSYAFVLVES